MKVNDILNLDIIDVDLNGNGISRKDNFVIFVKDALLDETVKVIITSIKKSYATAKILEVISPSKNRCNPICKYHNSCGGCNFLHTTFENEIQIKKKYISHLFNREVNVLKIKNEYNYRNKVVLHVKNNKLGLYDTNTHNLIEINECKLLHPLINKTIKELKTINLKNINEIMIRCINNKIMLNILNNNNESYDINCDSLYINNKYFKGEKYLIDEINGLKYTIYPESFYQVNNEGMTCIYNKAASYINNEKELLDLYCGTGTIGIWIHDKVEHVTGCEINASSIENAKLNLELNNINNVDFILNDAKNITGKYDVIIVDPPRNGLSKDVIKFLNESNSKKIIYISCNPITLKRDVDLLNSYELKDISICSMFPRTKHIESVVLLEKINN